MSLEKNTGLDNLTFDPSFFEDEEREGFFISSMMKRYWAAELTVLAKIDWLCRKYDIPWYADCGTLLGAVRHGGFIPWDDDLDICMLRSDYIRFLRYAKRELPDGFCLLNIHTESEYSSMLTRIVNAHEIDTHEDHLRLYHGCPYTVGIDIFPLDDLCPDQVSEEERVEQAQLISQTIDLIDCAGADTPEVRKILSKLEALHHTVLHRNGPLRQELRLLIEKLYTRYSSENAEYVALMPYWVKHHDHKYKKSWFEHRTLLPFESTFLPVPAVYNEVLKVEYGDFMQIHKGGGVHDYPVYGEQEAILKQTIRKNPYRYTMEAGVLKERTMPSGFREYSLEIIDTLLMAHENLSVDFSIPLLTQCQSLAIALGSALEKAYPHEQELVHILEDYCEIVYILGEKWENNGKLKLDTPIRLLREGLLHLFSEKKKLVLFLPCKSVWWPSMEPIWEKAAKDPGTSVVVMPIPYVEGDLFGNGSEHRSDDHDGFPHYVPLTDAEGFDIAAHHPDAIYIQNPFDEWSTTLQIPAFFHSANLRACTDQLIYIPCFRPDEPIDENDKAIAAIRVLIEQPAILHADQVLLPSEKMKELYLNTLKELSMGNEAYWDKKLTVDSSLRRQPVSQPAEKQSHGKKTILFHIDLPLLLQYGQKAIQKLQYARELLEGSADKLLCLFSPGEDLSLLKSVDPALWKEYHEFTDSLKENKAFQIDETREAASRLPQVSAYYGTPGVLAHRCRELGIPVMLMNVDVQ